MIRSSLGLTGLLCAILLFYSCQKQTTLRSTNLPEGFMSGLSAVQPGTGVLREPGALDCGTPLITSLVTSSYIPTDEQTKGQLKISNDGTNLYITVSTLDSSVKVGYLRIFYGDSALFHDINQYSWDGWTGVYNPQIVIEVPTVQSSYTVQIPLSTFNGDCVYFNVHSLFYTFNIWGQREYFPVWTKPLNPGDQAFSFPWSGFVKYCKQSCIPPVPPTCGQLRTQTPGGWGAKPAGNNPGTYLHANFAAAFPTGLTVGCEPAFNIKLTSAQAVTNLLPAAGKAVKLTSNSVNPTGVKNVLVGHLVALTLSVRFDAYDPNFGQAGITLGAMVIGSGPFQGWTVAQFLVEANKVLGGCSNQFTIQQVLDTATSINENYVDGKTNNRFLVCPTQ